jgi:hypothetical protein
MKDFLLGMLFLGCLTIALHFLRYWKESSDRLFLFFAAAFGTLALNWMGQTSVAPQFEARHSLFLLRLVAFLLIIVGVIDKNRRSVRSHTVATKQ